ncbi:MAG: NAD(P)H-quinone oxidoreductase [Stellaceae bacterium]|jgi:putative PIG3 family NAD(P)H quinone oxidoreductase
MSGLPPHIHIIEITAPGGPEMLKPAQRPMPKPGAGEVLIKVEAAGVNRPDVAQRKGEYPPPAGASDIPGLEIAGTVAALGPGVKQWKLGDKVCALVTGGGYADYCPAPEAQCLPVPKGLSMIEAAALPETYFTVWTNLMQRGGMKKGESVLIHGGTSGIGTTAIQIAKLFGAKEIFATAGSAEKCQACVRLGATRAIDYKREDFVKVVKEETKNRGVDLILDMVCGPYVPRNLASLAVEGRVVVIALLGGNMSEVNFGALMMKRQTITGSTLRARSVEQKALIAEPLRREVWPLLEAGKLKPVIYKTFPLKEAAAAHALMESSEHIGKIVLTL